MAEIRPVVYSKELQKQIFPDNSFYKKSRAETGVADNTEVVEKPVQGKIGKAKEGAPKKLPLEIQTSTDGKKTYPVTLLYCEPLLVDSQSELLVNYNKRASKQEQQAEELNLRAATYAAHKWSPTKTDNILKTSGELRDTHVVGMTSKRKAVTKADWLKVYNLILRMGVKGPWYAMLTADSYTDCLAIPDFVDYAKTGNTTKMEKGIIGNILGVEIFSRATEEAHAGVLYKADGTPVSGDSVIADDLLAGNLIWNPNMVCRAEGVVRTVINEEAPGYLGGTILESFVRFGADILRDDQRGVICLQESK